MRLSNYLCAQWVAGGGEGEALLDPVIGREIARVSSQGVDYAAALHFARSVGAPALRECSYGERAQLLLRVADVLTANRDDYYRIALENSGSTRNDAAVDVDGAIYTLKYYAKLGAALGGARVLRDGDLTRLGKDESFQALHVAVPLPGVAILINAFNFPGWGLWEKAAPALLAGMPVFVKPATVTAWLAQRMVQDVVTADVLPRGALSIACGHAGELLDHVTGADVIAFTGSADTAARIRSHCAAVQHSTRINVEADSLNLALLGPDAAAGSAEFDLLVNEVVAEMTVKAGQKCTAIRRILVPQAQYAAAADAIAARLARIVVGNPRNPEVRMGPLVSKTQQASVQAGIAHLQSEATTLFGAGDRFRPLDADPAVAAFVPPTLLGCQRPMGSRLAHEIEVFGPVATLLPYRDLEQALDIGALGGGSLAGSVFSADPGVMEAAALRLASTHGRVNIVSGSVARTHTGHGNVMPMCVHGGPGRAGGGQELGGLRALRLYHQTTALQGPSELLRAISERAVELHP